jgi:hypothetical protein
MVNYNEKSVNIEKDESSLWDCHGFDTRVREPRNNIMRASSESVIICQMSYPKR